MNSLRLVTLRTARPLRPLPTQCQPQRFFTSAQRLRLKEDKQRSPEEANQLKEEQRRKAEKGKGEWHEELASNSESHVAADKEAVHDHDEHMEDLQKQTANETQKKHPEAK